MFVRKVKLQFPQIFDTNDEIKLQPRSLAWIVSELQPYSLLETHVDVKGKAYEELVGANLRGDRGEFFTPRNIMRMAVEMVNPKPGEKVCDASCGNGIVFFSGKNISELDPSDKKYLSLSQHTERIKNELVVKEGMILVTPSETLANTVLVPKHWGGWTMTHNIIRLVPANREISGYLFAWLSSDYARELIHRFAYGAVVRHLEKAHISQVSVPLLCDENAQQEINDTVLEANRKRTEAYNLEQKALRVLDAKVIYAR